MFCTHLHMDVVLLFSMRRCDPMSTTSEAVVFSARIPFALFNLVKTNRLSGGERARAKQREMGLKLLRSCYKEQL
jgi:hypothetical protein